MNIKNRLWKDGKKCCLTFSYDDGRTEDRRLVKLFNDTGIKGTFNLASGLIGRTDAGREYLKPEEVHDLYRGHEIACHSYSHPTLLELPSTIILEEILRDKEFLESHCGYTVRGMAYPNGPFDKRTMELCAACGMRYARCAGAYTNPNLRLPDDFLSWGPSCHHNANLKELFDKLVNIPPFRLNMPLMYVYGHSYEFTDNNNWEHIEEFCSYASNHPDVWYATNIEIYDYVQAQRRVDYSIDKKTAYNPSAISVWIDYNGKPVELKPGHNRISG